MAEPNRVCANGRQIKELTVVDESTREALAIEVAETIRSERIIEVLPRLISVRGAPRYLRSDNGPESVSVALLKWITEQGVECALIDQASHGRTEQRKSLTAREVFDRIARFIERHGDSCFSSADTPLCENAIRANRAAWWCYAANGRGYLFNTNGCMKR